MCGFARGRASSFSGASSRAVPEPQLLPRPSPPIQEGSSSGTSFRQPSEPGHQDLWEKNFPLIVAAPEAPADHKKGTKGTPAPTENIAIARKPL